VVQRTAGADLVVQERQAEWAVEVAVILLNAGFAFDRTRQPPEAGHIRLAVAPFGKLARGRLSPAERHKQNRTVGLADQQGAGTVVGAVGSASYGS